MSFKESRLEQCSGAYLAFFSVLLYFVIIPWQIRHIPGVGLSPRTFPQAITGVLFCLSAALFVSGWLKRNRADQRVFSISVTEIKLSALTLLAVGGYALLLNVVPYIPSTMIVLAVLTSLYGQRKWWKTAALALVLPVLIHVAFTTLLRMHMP